MALKARLLLLFLSGVTILVGGCANQSSRGSGGSAFQLSVSIKVPQEGTLTKELNVEVSAASTGPAIDAVEIDYSGPESGRIPLKLSTGSWKGTLPASLPSGRYKLQASAKAGSSVVKSKEVSFTLDRDLPAVSFVTSSPSVPVRGSWTVQVRAEDSGSGVARVQLFDGGRLIGEQSQGVNGVYTFSVDTTKLEDGSHTLRAVAGDRAGNLSEATLGVRVDNTPPQVTWVNPAPGATVGGVVTLVVEATDGVSGSLTPTVKLNGQVLTDADAGQPGLQWDTQGLSGLVELSAEAVDEAGNRAVERIQVTVDQAVADRTPPAVSFVTSSPSVPVRGSWTVQVRAEDSGSGVARVQLFDGGRLIGEQSQGVNGVYTFSVDTTKLEDGSHTLRAVAGDRAGNLSEATLGVRVDNTPPQVTWVNPRDGQVLSDTAPNPFSLLVNVEDENPDSSSIQYAVDGNLLATPQWDLSSVQDGLHFLRAQARDLAGNEASAEISVTVDREPPQITWLSPSPGVALRDEVTLQIRAEDWPGVERVFVLVRRGAETQFLGEASGDGRFWTFTWDTTRFTNGDVSLEVVAVNRNGLQGVEGQNFVIDNPDLEKPVVTWIDPLPGQNVAGVYPLRVQARDNQAIREVRLYVGGQRVHTFTQPPYVFGWSTTSLQDGPVALMAVAIDTSGNPSEPAEIQVNIRNTGFPPALSILEPEEGGKVGVQFAVRASVTKQGSAFTWSQPLKAKVYDYRGNLVKEADMLVNNAPPPDDSDSVSEAFLDLGNVPSDVYRLVVEGEVQVNGNPFRLYQERLVSVVVSSNLPPALVVYQPVQDTILTGKTLYLAGEVTDDSGRVRAVEVRLIGGGCANPGQENYLMRYEAGPYGPFFMRVPLDGHPYITDGPYCLRVVAVDEDDFTLRNIQEFDVTVDRTASDPGGNLSVTTSSSPVVPGSSATWTVNFGSNATYTIFLRKDGVVQEVYKGTAPSVSFTRSFSDGDLGSWDVVAVYVAASGVQGALFGGSVAVVQPTGP
ncbi:Ig-like domain-containing protein [Thermus thermophilus]|uniref:Ig-like domain-containing protein n=1 Tax=Thermus thermophilus TaxID=274 RepID=UPI00194E8617|nr:Ig-like domain-containing protein [Thermus thermophilus]